MKLYFVIFLQPLLILGQDVRQVKVPSIESQVQHKGFVNFRCFVKIPEKWRDLTVMLWIDEITGVDEGYFNGERIGAHGSIDSYSKAPGNIRRPYIVPEDIIQYEEYNLLSIRILSPQTAPKIKGNIVLIAGDEMINLEGEWQLQEGDNKKFRSEFTQKDLEHYLKNTKIRAGSGGVKKNKGTRLDETIKKALSIYEKKPRHFAKVFGTPLSPEKSLSKLNSKDLEISLALNEPHVTQPIQTKFDEKGRMWVVQFGQYPDPAGLKTVGMDKYLRKIFDRKLPPPPYGNSKFKGKDKITVHKDKDGDGFYETSTTFLEGLNITTALEFDRDGVWVLSPPHLLFYKDKNKDGKADSNVPEVHLTGFNLEDTHAVANSLTLGPDGWLYGVTGSTTTGRVKVALNKNHPITSFLGQTVWRYHRAKKIFELFSEGGYNNFGLEFNERGHLFSGTNTTTSIVHFVQGGYFHKNLGKHGPHNNYYTFALLNTLKDKSSRRSRLIHQWLPYYGSTITELRGKFIGVNSLSNLVDIYSVQDKESSYECEFNESLITSKDKWFRPVHITSGPDGAIYIADWYDSRITHLDPRDNWDKKHGRIYRVQKKGIPGKPQPLDISSLSNTELIELLGHLDYWYRKTAIRIISERQDKSITAKLKNNINNSINSLESLWCLFNLDSLNNETYKLCLTHKDSSVREWSIRLLTDIDKTIIDNDLFKLLLKTAKDESSKFVLSQLAASAKRMIPFQSVQIIETLLVRDNLSKDQRITLQIWWALENIITLEPKLIKKLITDKSIANSSICKARITEFIGRRLIADPSDQNIDLLISMLKNFPESQAKKLLNGITTGSKGRKYQLKDKYVNQLDSLLSKFSSTEEIKILLLGDAYKNLQISKLISAATTRQKIKLIKSIGTSQDPRFMNEVINLFTVGNESEKKELLPFMVSFESTNIANIVLKKYSNYSNKLKYSILQLLSTREKWTAILLKNIESLKVPKNDVSNELKLVFENMKSPEIQKTVSKIWTNSISADFEKEVDRISKILKNGKGDPNKGKALFMQMCSSCHKLNGAGGFIGPDLSGYELNNLSYIIPAIVNPSLAIREGFELTQLNLKNGSTLSGYIKDQNNKTLKLMKLDGTHSTLNREDITDEKRIKKSLMPEGLLKNLNKSQILDLFQYLSSQVKK